MNIRGGWGKSFGEVGTNFGDDGGEIQQEGTTMREMKVFLKSKVFSIFVRGK